MKKDVLITCGILVLLTVLIVVKQNHTDKINNSIVSGINYIDQNQLLTGEIHSTACADEKLKKECSLDKNFYITASTIYSLDKINKIYPNKKTESIIENGIDYYLENIPKDDLWAYWPKDFREVPLDVDDTSIISFILEKHGHTSNNRDSIKNNTSKDGLFYTWIADGTLNNEGNPDYAIVDSFINTNVALYLNDPEVSSKICSYISSLIKTDTESSSHYWYSNDHILYYGISRAYTEGISCFGAEKDLIIKKITSQQKETGAISDNAFTTALSLNTLIGFGYTNKVFYEKSFRYLIGEQRADGGWDKFTFFGAPRYSWWLGSRSYTTAVALEAITKYYFK